MTLTQPQIDLQIRDVAEARHFYREILGCSEGHSEERRLDFCLHGQSIVCHLSPQLGKQGRVSSDYRLMGGQYLVISRCCVVLERKAWRALARRLGQHRVKFHIAPSRVYGVPVEPATLSLLDPSGNALEFKLLRDIAEQGSLRERLKAIGTWAALSRRR
jgi:extradiol dioxygenase family protein